MPKDYLLCHLCGTDFPIGASNVKGPNDEPFCSLECRDEWEEKTRQQTLDTKPTKDSLHGVALDAATAKFHGLVAMEAVKGDVKNAYHKGFDRGWELGMAEGFRRAALKLRAVPYPEYLDEVQRAMDAEAPLVGVG